MLVITVLTLSVIAAASWGQSAKTHIKDPALAKRFNKVSDDLVCQCGCNMGLRVCNHENCPSAIPMRHDIEEKLQAGASDDSITTAFVKEYGDKVLAEPPATGFNLAAYVMPGFAVLIGLFIVATFASRMSKKRRLSAGPAAPVDPEVRERIERELRSK
ncbi:MAG TPA: cytochrome c-type biogenesis protein [Candidatus Krumholzibacteria bacterium]|nr:cytochrome c-type biogenesis protein [Candidatus Krumholzibacteria bacterium]